MEVLTQMIPYNDSCNMRNSKMLSQVAASDCLGVVGPAKACPARDVMVWGSVVPRRLVISHSEAVEQVASILTSRMSPKTGMLCCSTDTR